VSGTHVEQLQLMAEHHPTDAAFVDLATGETLDFATWDDQARRLAGGLREMGVGPGDRVVLAVGAEAPCRWVVAHAGIQAAGAVAVAVNPALAPGELQAIAEHAEAVAAVASPGPDAALRAVVRRLVGTDDGSWAEVTAGPVHPGHRADPDDICDIVYTSGTTGRPKGVVVRHANASMIPFGLPAWSGAGWLACSPLFTFAGITAVYNPMKLGMTSLYLSRFDPAAWLRHVEERRPAMVFLVPAMAELLLAYPGIDEADLSSIGLCAVGSAPLAPATQRRLAVLMPEAAVSNAYGMTEAGPAYTVLPKEETERRAGSVGRPLPPAEFVVVGDDELPLPAGEVGELVIRVPGRPREYYRDPVATAETWRPDGLHTGDLARIDEDGYVYIVGRRKDVIIRGGNNVHAADVEAVLLEHPDVAEVAVAGVAHPVLGEDVAAWVVPCAGTAPAAEELRRFAEARLAAYKVPRRITLVDSLPRNATGKVMKASLVAEERPEGGTPPGPTFRAAPA
jgi:acyl-CoA synthetase (AMP-forming)/AMP-acid ligase II